MNNTILTLEQENLLDNIIINWAWLEESGISGSIARKLEALNLQGKLELIKALKIF